MPNNDFQTWACGAGANVESQANYVSDSTRTNGEVSGKATSSRSNKVWRQASMWATALGLFLNSQGQDANDDGNPANLALNFQQAVLSWITASSGLPSGSMMQFGGAAAPNGWLLCNGQAVSRNTYANLFSAIGTAYGQGDGSSTFNLPDARGRVMAGWDPSNTTARLTGSTAQGASAAALGNVGGEQAHVQSLAELANHNHSINDPTHAHAIADPSHAHAVADPEHVHTLSEVPSTTGGGGSGGNPQPAGGATLTTDPAATGIGIYPAVTGIGIYNAATGIGIVPQGGSAAANVVQPTLITNFIIKI